MNRAKLLTIICAAALPVMIPGAMSLKTTANNTSAVSQSLNKSENITLLVSNNGNNKSNNEENNNSQTNVESNIEESASANSKAVSKDSSSNITKENSKTSTSAKNDSKNLKESTSESKSNSTKVEQQGNQSGQASKESSNGVKNNSVKVKNVSNNGENSNKGIDGGEVEVAYIGTPIKSGSGYAEEQVPELQQKLYNYLSSTANQEAVMKEAVNLHGGNASDTCVYFLATALRNIGVDIPTSTAYTTILEGNLLSRGWVRSTNLDDIQKGDICFAGPYHVYVFMGWKDKEKGLAYIVDNQAAAYGNSHYHERNINGQNPENEDQHQYPTTCFYRYSGNKVNFPSKNTVMLGNVTSGTLNVRASASDKGEILGTLSYNTEVKIIDQVGNWYKIQYKNGTGYVYGINISPKKIVTGENINPDNSTNKPDNSTPAPEAKESGVVTANELNVRAGASTNSAIIGSLKKGDKVGIIKKEGNWYEINYNGRIAYVSADYVQVEAQNKPEVKPEEKPETKPEVKPETKPEQGQTMKVKVNSPIGLNLRAGATTNSAVITVLPNNAVVNVIESSNGWYKVNYNGNTGWIFAQYTTVVSNPSNGGNTVKPEEKPQVKPEVKPEGSTSVTKVQITSPIGLNVRTSPSTSGNVITAIPNNVVVSVIESSNGWYKVNYNGTTGWIYGAYTKVISSTGKPENNTPESKPEQNQAMKVKVNSPIGLNLRAGATTNSAVITVLPNNVVVNVIESSNGWYKVSYNGSVGWIFAQYTTNMTNNNTSNNTTNNSVSKIRVNSPIGLNLRTGAGTNNRIILAIPNNGVATVLGSSNGWYKVNYNGNIGWVDGNYVNAI
ncbi:SH3 domain-containing protein [Clostridium massiliamazoniense]|uniref:SH3 domain-containing protein n=1 Tax=Clostridium massiliamazoniense TaxID=1347366 RepID=UPI0006D824E0|nr:SH3 domain-containing protein [Clostridium massiliamazoniense]